MKDWGSIFAPAGKGRADDQPTGATTTGSGVKADQAIPALERVTEHYNPPAQNAAKLAPGNTWTQNASTTLQGSPPDPWIKECGHDMVAPPATEAQRAIVAAMLAHLERMDSFFGRMRSVLEPQAWSVVTAGGVGTGLGMGTIGAGTIYPVRCLLEGVHNPTAGAVTFGIGDTGSGDPTPKLAMTVAAGAIVPFGTRGVFFQNGISLLTMTAGGILTFFGSDAAQ
jgi:hypothetical protein